jgi:hypothetical protein
MTNSLEDWVTSPLEGWVTSSIVGWMANSLEGWVTRTQYSPIGEGGKDGIPAINQAPGGNPPGLVAPKWWDDNTLGLIYHGRQS